MGTPESFNFYGTIGSKSRASISSSISRTAMAAHTESADAPVREKSNQPEQFYLPLSKYGPPTYQSYSSTSRISDYSCHTEGWAGHANYAVVPRSWAGSHSQQLVDRAEPCKRKDDYQDIWKKSREKAAGKLLHDGKEVKDVCAVAPSIPAVPSKMYTEDPATQQTSSCQPHEDTSEPVEAPPNIAPVSGFLCQRPGKAIVRPIAFKAVVPCKSKNRSGFSPAECHAVDIRSCPTLDDGYVSQDTSRTCSHSTISRNSNEPHSDSYESSPAEKASGFHETPSPSDVAAIELEQILEEKETEVMTLRETMELNERVIFQVHEERRRSWENQMKELTAEYHRRLRTLQDRSQKTESDLQSQITNLQYECQRLRVEQEALMTERERNSKLQDQTKQLKMKSEDLSQKLAEMTREYDFTRQHASDNQEIIKLLREELATLKAENMNLSNDSTEKDRLLKKLEKEKLEYRAHNLEIQQLQKEIDSQENLLRRERERFAQETLKWEEEKTKVIQYQKQLQLTYQQLCKKNSDLEAELSKVKDIQSQKSNYCTKVDKTTLKLHLDSKPESLC